MFFFFYRSRECENCIGRYSRSSYPRTECLWRANRPISRRSTSAAGMSLVGTESWPDHVLISGSGCLVETPRSISSASNSRILLLYSQVCWDSDSLTAFTRRVDSSMPYFITTLKCDRRRSSLFVYMSHTRWSIVTCQPSVVRGMVEIRDTGVVLSSRGWTNKKVYRGIPRWLMYMATA